MILNELIEKLDILKSKELLTGKEEVVMSCPTEENCYRNLDINSIIIHSGLNDNITVQLNPKKYKY